MLDVHGSSLIVATDESPEGEPVSLPQLQVGLLLYLDACPTGTDNAIHRKGGFVSTAKTMSLRSGA